MIHRWFLLILTSMACLTPAGARAQECAILPSGIADLRDPAFPSPAVWSLVHGDKNLRDRLVSGVAEAESGHLIVAGERTWSGADPAALTLARIDGRGRVLWERIVGGIDFAEIVKLLPVADGYLVLANRREGEGGGRSVWFGRFDAEGRLRGEKSLKDSKLSLEAKDILPLPDGKGYWLVAATPGGKGGKPYALFFKLDNDFKVTDRKSLNIGLGNTVHALALLSNGDVMGAGSIETADGREAGWLLRLDYKGVLSWQRPHARGRRAAFTKILTYNENYVAVLGVSEPYDIPQGAASANKAGWVALADQSDGDILWERFYTDADFHLAGSALSNHDKGLVSAAFTAERAQAMEEGDEARPVDGAEGFVRLVTLNERGVVLQSQSYFQGRKAAALAATAGRGQERILMGAAEVPVRIPAGTDADGAPVFREFTARQGWAIAAESVPPYNDPCSPKKP